MYTKAYQGLVAAGLISQVVAHGYVRTWTLDGVDFDGYSKGDGQPGADAIGWSYSTPDEGPEMDLTSPGLACRSDGKSAQSSGQIAAGGTVGMFWTSNDKQINPDGWAESHRGPVITYLAPCNGDCSGVDASSLQWTKIAEQGVTGPANTQGTWATDEMRANGGVASATIPSDIAAGNYVIRNEIIALHRAHLGEPEFYPQCANLEIIGSGSNDLSGSGVPSSQLYSNSDEQIFGFSVYDNRGDSWVVPGPSLLGSAGTTTAGGSNSTGTGATPATSSSASVPVAPPTTTGYEGWKPRGGRTY
ncbi:uncharacterized protein HMPREF1541_09694 [Cyphellophora europaea CBS 101466]|uniref:Auxiliary Activity family 9 catalytic domain-containing protein n=1 Tax=Cyphellophora europaea (strain CBS 101466) TaxID=1220924 RepID=W2SA85_CYPE1|nr:uncharacterized protein HMPREF1541_09694 [Cyphellophora europaea CBS 101466]ETN44819.1 hypothetical protein HMPREF1541_09694 [Cyphellophora europaea CBS 101466]